MIFVSRVLLLTAMGSQRLCVGNGLNMMSRPPARVRTMMMAQPNKKLPERSVKVFCKCKTQLYVYKKGGKGSLVKCFVERIAQDFTTEECVCPSCNAQFARPTMIRGKPAFKIIGGKAYQK